MAVSFSSWILSSSYLHSSNIFFIYGSKFYKFESNFFFINDGFYYFDENILQIFD